MMYSCFVVTIVYVRYMSVVYYLVLYSTVLLNNTSMNAPRLLLSFPGWPVWSTSGALVNTRVRFFDSSISKLVASHAKQTRALDQ